MITCNPSSADMYRFATLSQKAPLVYVRKLCGCGKRITDREQNQFGKCRVCVRDAKAAQ